MGHPVDISDCRPGQTSSSPRPSGPVNAACVAREVKSDGGAKAAALEFVGLFRPPLAASVDNRTNDMLQKWSRWEPIQHEMLPYYVILNQLDITFVLY